MASDDLDLDTGDVKKEDAAGKGGNKLILIIALVLVLAGGGGGAFWFMSGEKTKPVDKVEVVKKDIKMPAEYEPFPAEFVVKLKDRQGDPHHMVIAVSLMTRDAETKKAIKLHNPFLNNGLLELFALQNYEQMKTVTGKKELRQKSLVEVKKLLAEQSENNKVEAVLFTNFMLD